MIEKLKTGLWFLRRPRHWEHAGQLVLRKFKSDHDAPDLRAAARDWAASRSVVVSDALADIGLIERGAPVPVFPSELLEEGQVLAARSAVSMGGPGDLNLLYAAVKLSGARRVVETGVAYGWSSLAILAALDGESGARLVSVDMPYPKMGNEAFVGIVVPDRMRSGWDLIREPDRRGVEKAIARLSGRIDLCHYDSDKSWWGRLYAYPILWKALSPGGVFISDDIQDNLAFAEFVEQKRLPFAVTEFEGKYVGILRKAADD